MYGRIGSRRQIGSHPRSRRREFAPAPPITTCYYDHEIHERNPYADPTNASDVSGVAPATVVTAGVDPLRDGGKAYTEQLVRDGVSTRYEDYADQVYGFMTRREVDRAAKAIADVAADLADAFRAD